MRNTLLTFFLVFIMSFICACSNSEFVDEFGIPVNDYAFEEGSQDTAYLKDSFTSFPPSGFYAKPFTIIFPDDTPLNCETGGLVPTKESPLKKEISIDSTSTVRCANFFDNSNTEIIRTYIFEKKPTIPTIFITTDPYSLFDPDTGIYMEGPNAEEKTPHYGANYWLDKELPIFIELTETDSFIPAFSKYAGLQIFGNYSRMNAKKSVAITFREKYGDKRLNYTLFPEFPELTIFKSFILRNFGNSFGSDYIRDRLASSLSEGLGVDYQRGRFVIVYYNGKYFGIHDMRERANEYYFETHYGINHKQINLIKNSTSDGSESDYTSLINWLKNHNLDNEENFKYIASKIDISNTINYIQVETYAYNRDWPGNNTKKWKCSVTQTPWKWFLYDLDLTFGETRDNLPLNVFEYILSETEIIWQNNPKHTFLYRQLMKNRMFKTAFINRMMTLLQMNFESSRVLTKIEKMMAEIEDEIARDQKRWSLSASKMNEHLKRISQFANDRPFLITSHLQEYFNLGEIVPITLSVNGNGTILIHDLPLDATPLTIPYFKDLPVTISAKPGDGSLWSHWSDGDTNSTRIIHPEKTKKITAIFK